MRNKVLWLAPALMASLVLVGASSAQTPDKKGEAPRAEGRRGPGGRTPGFGGRGGPGGIEQALADLKLTDKKKEKAEAAVKAYQENVRKLTDLARADLLVKMQEILSEQELKTFKVALDRPPAPGPGGRGPGGRGPGGRGPGGRGLSADAIVERILSFDKDKNGKVTKEELPERMRDLIAKGDTNKDGALDKDEIKKLSADLARDGSLRGLGGGGRFPPGGGFGPGGGLERVVADLKLADKKKEKAEAAVKAYPENVRKLRELARADLLVKMQETLSEQEFKSFKTALERLPARGPGGRGGRPPQRPAPTGAGTQGDLEKKLDQLQKDLDSLRREIRR